MQRSARVSEQVVPGDRFSLEHQNRHVIQIEEYTSQPEKPETSQCSSTGLASIHTLPP